MPGRGSYGPGGRWIHDRAERIMEKNPEMPKSMAYATATQQAHKVGKSPKGFRTSEGMRTAKEKFRLPKKEYRKTASYQAPPHPFEFTLKGMLIKEALGKKKRQQAQRRKAKLKQAPKGSYESPSKYVERTYSEKGLKDPGTLPKSAPSARVKAREMGIKTRSGRVQPYTVRQRKAGVLKPASAKPGPKVEKKPQGRVRPAKPKLDKVKLDTIDVPPKTVKKVTQQASKLRRYGVPIGLGLAGAAALGGAAYAMRRRKKSQEEIDKYWGGKKKTAMLQAFMDELEKISQAPGSLQDRAAKGAPGAWGGLGGGPAAAGGGAETPPPTPASPTLPPSPGGGSGGMDMPSADPFGGKGAPGGGDPMGGASSGGDPMGGAKPPPPLPPPPAGTGTGGGAGASAGSLLSPQRKKGMGSGKLDDAASAEVAPPSASEFGG